MNNNNTQNKYLYIKRLMTSPLKQRQVFKSEHDKKDLSQNRLSVLVFIFVIKDHSLMGHNMGFKF